MKVIIDTDPGIDDAMALLFAHYANDIELLGITTVFGNGTIDTVTQNTLTICEQFQINAPVHQGAGAPLQVAVDPPPAFVHGNDGLGDIDAPKPKGAARNQSAANFIVETILKHPNEITVIGIGRLTNLAIALQQHPAIAQLVKKVVIMGGALGSNAHTGNVTPRGRSEYLRRSTRRRSGTYRTMAGDACWPGRHHAMHYASTSAAENLLGSRCGRTFYVGHFPTL